MKIFRCQKCGYQFIASSAMIRDFKCGAVIDYVEAEVAIQEDNPFFTSVGMKPVGCGGTISEISEEEALKDVEE